MLAVPYSAVGLSDPYEHTVAYTVKRKMTRKDWTLLAIAAADGGPLTPVQLQKILFLLGQRMPGAVGQSFYQFEPYHYGPFDRAIYSDAERLAQDGLVEMRAHEKPSQYVVTSEGARIAEELAENASPEAVDYLRRVVKWARGMSFPALLRAIYAKYPAFRVNSVFQD